MPLQSGTTPASHRRRRRHGQVWQATDTQLNREVALKILPDAFAADPDRLARFTREAQILASLNHPNIAAIYGIEEAEGTRALVLETLRGVGLFDRGWPRARPVGTCGRRRRRRRRPCHEYRPFSVPVIFRYRLVDASACRFFAARSSRGCTARMRGCPPMPPVPFVDPGASSHAAGAPIAVSRVQCEGQGVFVPPGPSSAATHSARRGSSGTSPASASSMS